MKKKFTQNNLFYWFSKNTFLKVKYWFEFKKNCSFLNLISDIIKQPGCRKCSTFRKNSRTIYNFEKLLHLHCLTIIMIIVISFTLTILKKNRDDDSGIRQISRVLFWYVFQPVFLPNWTLRSLYKNFFKLVYMSEKDLGQRPIEINL